MINIEKILLESPAAQWKINSTKTESYELFFVHSKLETVRATDTDATTVTVYLDHDGKKGQASFKLYASTTEEEAKAKIASALEKAALISNEYYSLPDGEKLDGAIESNFNDYEPKVVAAKIADATFSADMLGDGSVKEDDRAQRNKEKLESKNETDNGSADSTDNNDNTDGE